jgi:type II secretory pathway pseudopilin PulG
MKLQKAAMFGLDARIALAIFGALSVISGAALYSAIKQAKVTATIVDMNELAKSYEQYILDTGQDLAINSQDIYIDMYDLVEDNSVAGWNGPYTSHPKGVLPHVLKYKDYPDIFIIHGLDETWPAWSGTPGDVKCVTGKKCMVYVGIDGAPVDLVNAIDEQIDGSVDYLNGNVRVFTLANNYHLFIKQRPTLVQP